jgi:hypothetical protein
MRRLSDLGRLAGATQVFGALLEEPLNIADEVYHRYIVDVARRYISMILTGVD